MLLNKVEKALMNNPVRRAIQRWFEAPRLQEMGGRIPSRRALEIGCGRGEGVRIILERFGAASVDAFDLDPHMIRLACHRLPARYDGRIQLWVGDATAIEAPDGSYDAVFDFGIIHHVPDWRTALGEIFRVLRPGGRLFAEEVYGSFLASPIWRRMLDHPAADRFEHGSLGAALETTGFRIAAESRLGRWCGWFIADKPG